MRQRAVMTVGATKSALVHLLWKEFLAAYLRKVRRLFYLNMVFDKDIYIPIKKRLGDHQIVGAFFYAVVT